MKKFITIILSFLMIFGVFAFAGCGDKDDKKEETASASLRLRSEGEQEMKVGETMSIVYSTSPVNQAVSFKSSDESVVTVDKFATVKAVGAGEASVTLTLDSNPSQTAKVNFIVTRNNFMIEQGYYNGSINFGNQDKGEPVKINGGQTQLLANAAGQKWYFKTRLDHNGYVDNDAGGFWGVGSFLVNSANAIGNTMFWFMLRSHGNSPTLVDALYGGWRYATDVPADRAVQIDDTVYDISDGVTFTVMRSGTMHYVIGEFGSGEDKQILKYAYNVPYFENLDTFPGVFSQRQKLTVSDYSMSNNPDEVDKILETFQLAEEVCINDLDGHINKLTAGKYNLTATVKPSLTVNKGVTYSLENAVNGISLTAEGELTIASNTAVGTEFTVVATAVSDKSVSGKKTYTVSAETEGDYALFDESGYMTDSKYVQADQLQSKLIVNNATYAYYPLSIKGEKWQVTATVKNSKTGNEINGSEIGIMSATGGYMNYITLGINYANSVENDIAFGELGKDDVLLEKAANGGASADSSNTLSLIKDGKDYYVTVNGRFTKKLTAGFGGVTTPVLYLKNTGATFSDVEVTADSAEIDAYIASNAYFVGSYVRVNNGIYDIRAIDLGGAGSDTDTLDWPPDNDYCNGLKSTKAFDGNFTIEFKMSDVKPFNNNGKIDAKILIYLKSERTTSSLQFEIKKDGGVTTAKFVPNLDDNTWTTYELPEGVDILSGETSVKVVRKDDCVELYLNGTQVFKDENFMLNTGYWGSDTVATPGIGTFMCGVKISDISFTAN